ncbi:hypothetical protein V8G54_011063 [Vigna mungo]|uniref:Uncharacterized protein n=1 Tax=Vigna mungo TaxID=3915 RepID=A0AAQ3NQW0_VIGMU
MTIENRHLSNDNFVHQYLQILDFLININEDVNVLVDKKIIVNWMGDAHSVTTMINRLSSNISGFDPQYFSLCNSLNIYYENPHNNKYKAIFVHEYFNTPWKIASTVAAIVLLLLTFIQTVCSIISVVQSKKS